MSSVTLIKAMPKSNFENYSMSRDNFGYRIEVDGGDIVHFRVPGSSALWASRLSVEGVLPSPVVRVGNTNNGCSPVLEDTAMGCITDWIDALDTVPYENMSGYETYASEVGELLKDIVADIGSNYTQKNSRPAFALNYILQPDDRELIPATVRITPTVRGSFSVNP